MASSCSTRCPVETMPLRHELIDSLRLVEAKDWDALHDSRNPFVAHAFLDGLERHDCIRETWGWTPRHLKLWEGDRLVAAAPGYPKDNSHGRSEERRVGNEGGCTCRSRGSLDL